MNQQEIIDVLNETPNLKQKILSHFMQAHADILTQKEKEPDPIALGIQYAPNIISGVELCLKQNPTFNREEFIKSTILPIRYTLACMVICEQELLEKGIDLDYCRSYFTTLVEEVEKELKI